MLSWHNFCTRVLKPKRKSDTVDLSSLPHFGTVVSVLSTNGVPKNMALGSTWDKLPEAIATVIKAMEKYVQKSQSPTPGLQSVLVTTPFNLEKECATDRFINLLRKSCQDVGACYVHVPWADEHKQKPQYTSYPNKDFNIAGITLLTTSIIDMHKK